ncbi:uncharacterized protein LOC143256443 isoform X8 [Tachypleus tridentatus]|uniref:uncharacterized protein LOC143256443 isoform X8 n=1 Tax=Tachypleus tridentatus TaxID=6853 RepID=UPI003FD314A8
MQPTHSVDIPSLGGNPQGRILGPFFRSIQTSPQTMSVNSNSSAASDKKYNSKRSYGYIRPPNIQRDSQSQVTLKGWLFRLEGGALRQWRRRWFVLTDYCLFYYRDSDENKLLGSVILPSYRISPCSANDKITRKYAFKAEHSNMKTYFFAVESRELMIQWMNALCLATIMQTFTRSHHSTDQLSVPPTPGLDEEDSGFVSYQSRKLQDQDDPQATLDSSFASAQSTLDFSRDIDGNIVTNDGASDSGFVSSHYGSQSGIPYSVYTRGKTGQLYYAAAPPKPKRLHASYTALPQCVPDLVPPQEINLGRGKFVPLCDYESFYEFGKNERSYRKCDNWEGNYDNLTSEGGKYHQPQPELYLPMSAALKKTPGSQSMLESERDYENTAIYRDSLQPLSNNPRQPPLIRRHSDIFGDNMTGYDQQLQKMPSTSSKHPFHSQPRVEKHDHDVYDKGGRDLACVYDACDSRVLGNIPGNTYHRTKTESGYQTNTSFKGHQYQDQVIGSLYPGSGNNSDRQVLDRQVHRADNSRGIVSARPIFVNENIYVPFDADRKEPSVCVFQHGTGSSNGQESQSNSLREESMKKLLEWKERMLLSPLTKINNHEETKNIAPATSSGSPGIPPPRPPLPEEYCHEVLQNLELHEMQQKLHELQLQSNGINTVVSPGQVGAPELSDNIPVSEVTPKPRRLSCGEVELQIHRHMKKAIGGRRDNDKSQKSNRTLYRSNEHHQSTSALCRLATSYSSDDEESPSSSSNVRGNYRPKVRRASYRGKRSNQHKAVGRVSVSDSELHVHRSSMKCRLLQFSSGLTAKHKNVSVSAGELLEKSHEELVLLLIQLRQNQRQLLKSQQQCHLQMAKEQRLMQMNSYENEHKRNYMMLCQQMEKLQEEEKGIRHLVNLVANLVKLRTLKSSTENNTASPPRLDGVRIEKYIPSEKMLEFAHHLQERQRLRGEIESIEMASLDHEGLEEKLSRLYQLNYLVQEEYSEFVFIQKDEEMLEQSLKTVQEKLSEVGRDNPVGLEKLRKQQRLIEKELAHIYSMLSQSTVRLQQGILKESQVEHKILVFRQKMEHALVVSHRRKEMSSISKADLEAELLRLQSLLESLAKHRQEISNAIQTLKFNSKQKRLPGFQKVRGKVSGVVGFAALPSKRKNQSAYMETDLDSCSSQEFCVVKNPQPRLQWQEMAEVIDHSRTLKNGPMLDIAQPENQNTLDQERQGRLSRHNQKTSLNWSGQLVGEYGLPLKVLPQEKPKKFDTIRKSSSCTSDKKGGQAAAWMVDSVKNHEVAKDKPLAPNRPTSLFSPTRKVQTHRRTLSAYERLFGGASTSSLSTPSAEQRASGYHSQTSPRHHGQSQRKPKRRHHTITGSGSQPLLGISSPRRFSPSSRHIRMDRNSRTASTPDIVRSTIRKSEVFDEKVIDRELGLPQKIDIPERYIEDEPEKLSTAEKLKRNQKAENIRKMLCEVTAYEESSEAEGGVSETMKKKVDDEKKKRAHLLALNHTIAKEVMEKSKIVAMIATLERLHPDTEEQMEGEVQDEDWSPVQSLPVIQQRENYFT